MSTSPTHELKPGLASVTFRHLDVGQIMSLAREARLAGIEWGGDVHVPHGELEVAERVGRMTREHGLETAAYGSYYKVGVSERDDLPFATVCDTAQALGAPRIRVWAGDRGAASASGEFCREFVREARRITEQAAGRGLDVVLEFHNDTLADSALACHALLEAIDRPNMRICWQPVHGAGVESNLKDIEFLAPWIAGVHVFHWWPTHETRHPLAAGRAHWSRYLDKLRDCGVSAYASLEFVEQDCVENFCADARTLLELLSRCGTTAASAELCWNKN